MGLIVTRGAAFDGCVFLLCPTLERPSAKTRDVTRDLPKPPASGRAPRASRHRKREGEKHLGGAPRAVSPLAVHIRPGPGRSPGDSVRSK